MKPHWEFFSIFFYIILALTGLICMAYIKEKKVDANASNFLKNWGAIVWVGIWTFFTTFRLVTKGTGGTDAPNYIHFFEHCLDERYTPWMKHAGADILFKWINQAIRYLTDDYHLYFIAIYGFMIGCYVYFLKAFSHSKCNIAPYVLTFFLVVRGFSSIRSNLAIAFIMLACVFLLRKEMKKAYALVICSILIHKAALLFALCIPFCHIFYQRRMSMKWILLSMFLSYIFGLAFQQWFIQFTHGVDLKGVYGSYASHSLSTSYFNSAWKIAFEQLVLACVALFYESRIKLLGLLSPDETKKRSIRLIWLLFIFDILLIPINYILDIWRGYEFMYLPRIVLWAIILHLCTRDLSKDMRVILTVAFTVIFLAWMVFRWYNTYEDSHLLPYIFKLI